MNSPYRGELSAVRLTFLVPIYGIDNLKDISMNDYRVRAVPRTDKHLRTIFAC